VAAPTILNSLCLPCQTEWQQLQDQLELLSVSYVVKPTLVRGLDYYNKTVFEFVSRHLGAQDSFCAGGRYDQLVGQLGGAQDQPSIGAAIGFERLLLLVEQKQNNEQISPTAIMAIIIPVAKEQESLALLVADHLRVQQISVDALFDGSMKQKMKQANRLQARFVILIGEDEQKNHSVTIKEMATGVQQTMLQREAAAYLKGRV
jgi:histidyl-tRNA synthetase